MCPRLSMSHPAERRKGGGLDFETIRAELMAEYLEWLDSPQAKLDDSTPRDVVQIERMDAEETQAVDDQPAAEDDNDGDSSRY